LKIIHTADLHLGQIIYQSYDRVDEHAHYFAQLEQWCEEEHPDALIVSGDIFDIQQPSAATRQFFNERFVSLARKNPAMTIVITAGNHDSAARIQADRSVWELGNVHLVGVSPSADAGKNDDRWQDNYIVRLDAGYIVALPYIAGDRRAQVQALLDRVAAENTDGKPVVLTAHLAVTGSDMTGHGEIGTIRTQDVSTLGTGYDYLALGHIHKPQTLGHPEDALKMEAMTYPSGVARYSGSALHVSCDETYPHTVSIVEMTEHGGNVTIRQLRIDELMHFYVLPKDGSAFNTAEEALAGVRRFRDEEKRGYFRLRVDYKTSLPSNFNQYVYEIISASEDEVRYNPKTIWEGAPEGKAGEDSRPVFEVAELQQMKDPVTFIEKTHDQYPNLDLDMVRSAFEEVKEEVHRLEEEERTSQKEKADRRAAKKAAKVKTDSQTEDNA